MAIDFDSLEKTQKVLTFGAPQNNKTYPVRIIVWDRDKQPPSPKQVTSQVEIKDGEGKLPSDMYKHVGMGAKIKVDGKLVTLESKKSENFDISFSNNKFNIIGKRELSNDNSRQSKQDDIDFIDKLIYNDRMESIKKRNLVTLMMRRIQERTIQRGSKNAVAFLSANQLPTGAITVEKMVSMNAYHEKIDDFVADMEKIAEANCHICGELHKQNATEKINEAEKRAYEEVASEENISQKDLNTITSLNNEELTEQLKTTKSIDFDNTIAHSNKKSNPLFIEIDHEISNNINNILKKENPEKQTPEIVFDPSPLFESVQEPQNDSLVARQEQIEPASNPENEHDTAQTDEDKLTTRERHKLFKDEFVDKQVDNLYHHSNMDEFGQMLDDKFEEFVQSQELEVQEFKQNYDRALKKEYNFFTRYFREEMRVKLNEKSRALLKNKTLTPEERKNKLLDEHAKIKKQQQKELTRRIMRINREYTRLYTGFLLHITKENETFMKSLKQYAPDSYEHEHDHMPILGVETEHAFQHLKQDTENAVKKAKELYSTLQSQHKTNEAESLAKCAKTILGVDLSNEANQTQNTNQEAILQNPAQSTPTIADFEKQESNISPKQTAKTSPAINNVNQTISPTNVEAMTTVDIDKVSEQSGFELPHTSKLVTLYQQALGARKASKEDAQSSTSKLVTRRHPKLDIESMTAQAQISQFKGA